HRDSVLMISPIQCKYCSMPISSAHQWETEALSASGSCLECVEKIEKGELIIQRRIGSQSSHGGE
ncbi:MAG: hypothetical protein AB8A71_08255, partial [Prochlorococcus sp.]